MVYELLMLIIVARNINAPPIGSTLWPVCCHRGIRPPSVSRPDLGHELEDLLRLGGGDSVEA